MICLEVSFFNKIRLRACSFIKKRLWYKCFPVNFAKFFRTLFFVEHAWSTASTQFVFNVFGILQHLCSRARVNRCLLESICKVFLNSSLHKLWNFTLWIYLVNMNIFFQFSAALFTLTKETFHWKLLFLCVVYV